MGSGLGDYAREWLPYVETFTLTEANPQSVQALTARFAGNSKVTVYELSLPCDQYASHSCVLGYNVLEHILDHTEALRSMARLVQPGGYIAPRCAQPFRSQ